MPFFTFLLYSQKTILSRQIGAMCCITQPSCWTQSWHAAVKFFSFQSLGQIIIMEIINWQFLTCCTWWPLHERGCLWWQVVSELHWNVLRVHLKESTVRIFFRESSSSFQALGAVTEKECCPKSETDVSMTWSPQAAECSLLLNTTVDMGRQKSDKYDATKPLTALNISRHSLNWMRRQPAAQEVCYSPTETCQNFPKTKCRTSQKEDSMPIQKPAQFVQSFQQNSDLQWTHRHWAITNNIGDGHLQATEH